MEKTAIIIDIDGTIANLDHRLEHLGPPKNFEAFYEGMREDVFKEDAWAKIVEFVEDNNPHYIYFVTGRPDSHRRQTALWLSDNEAWFYLKPSSLLMRKAEDRRPDIVVKREIYEDFIKPHAEVIMAFEDRPSVIRMWTEAGIPVTDMGDGIEF